MRRLLCLLVCTGLLACGALSGADEFAVVSAVPAAGGSGGGEGGSGGMGGSELTCPSGRGPAMVLVEGSWGPYCVDSTEVTIAQYTAFVESGPETTTDDPECGWKADYLPRQAGFNCLPRHSSAQNRPEHAIACVDWCDARKFCNWAGKRLCGGADGGDLPYSNLTELSNDEWFVACSADGAVNYPYGDEYIGSRCAGDDYDGMVGDGASDSAEVVGSATACEGGFAGLFDMSGNLHEWVDSCERLGGVLPEDQRCRARGGSFWDGANSLTCAFAFDFMIRSSYNNNYGIRCCADAEAPM